MMRHKGFTLIEIAIAMVIIGLLIAGVIKGSGLIEGAKVSNAITLAQDLSIAVNAFKQQYHLLPGDMAVTTADFPTVSAGCQYTGGLTNDGLIDTPAESACVPEVLSLAGLAKVDRDAGVPVFKSYYGSANVIATNLSHVVVNNGSNKFLASVTHVVEFANLPCEIVQQIDRKIDNDDLATGKAIAQGVTVTGTTCTAGSIVPFYAVAL